MPKEAIERGAAMKVLALKRIPADILSWARFVGEPRSAVR